MSAPPLGPIGDARRRELAEIDRSILAHLPASANELAMVCNVSQKAIQRGISRLAGKVARIGNVYQVIA